MCPPFPIDTPLGFTLPFARASLISLATAACLATFGGAVALQVAPPSPPVALHGRADSLDAFLRVVAVVVVAAVPVDLVPAIADASDLHRGSAQR